MRLSTGLTQSWTYDLSGNITKRTVNGVETNYAYEDAHWGDLLTGYGSVAYESDKIGNLEDDGTWQYQWVHGRKLKKMTHRTTGEVWEYTYDADGLRTERSHTADGTTTTWEYVWSGSQLTQMKKGSDTLYFTYDASGTPTTVTHNGTVYYYVTNLQGDVVKIVSATGTVVATYTYDAWGNPLGTVPTTGIAALNPLRYRGYVYDPETELYYLQSRYYNPEIGRFINADCYATTGQGFSGNNMFAYGGNNPVNNVDYAGTMYERTLGGGGGPIVTTNADGVGGITQNAVIWYVIAPTVVGGLALAAFTAEDQRQEQFAIRRYYKTKEQIDVKIDAMSITATKQEIPQYYIAYLHEGQVIPYVPVSYSDALAWVTAGGNLLCAHHSAAFAIVKFFPSAIWDGRHGCEDSGYLNHYHLSTAHDNHIWYRGD